MKPLGEFIQNSLVIKDIKIGNNGITDKSIEILQTYLIGNTILKRFSISYNKGITNKSIPLLKEINQKSNIQDTNISGTSITNQNIFATLSELRKKLKKIIILRNN